MFTTTLVLLVITILAWLVWVDVKKGNLSSREVYLSITNASVVVQLNRWSDDGQEEPASLLASLDKGDSVLIVGKPGRIGSRHKPKVAEFCGTSLRKGKVWMLLTSPTGQHFRRLPSDLLGPT